MTAKEKKEYLNRVRYLKRSIDSRNEQLEILRAISERSTSSIKALRLSGTARRSNVEDAAIQLLEIEDGLAEDLKLFAAAYADAVKAIGEIRNPNYRQLLELRYLQCLGWGEVTERMGYTYNHVIRYLHPKALDAVNFPLNPTKKS